MLFLKKKKTQTFGGGGGESTYCNTHMKVRGWLCESLSLRLLMGSSDQTHISSLIRSLISSGSHTLNIFSYVLYFLMYMKDYFLCVAFYDYDFLSVAWSQFT